MHAREKKKQTDLQKCAWKPQSYVHQEKKKIRKKMNCGNSMPDVPTALSRSRGNGTCTFLLVKTHTVPRWRTVTYL